jgi:hypothetical protein
VSSVLFLIVRGRRTAWALGALALLAVPFACGEDGGGGGTGPGPCSVDSECKDDNPCSKDLCGEDGVCTTEPEPNGMAAEQVEGDCLITHCIDGARNDEIDDGDIPDDKEPCTLDICTDGVPSHTEQLDQTSCQVGLGSGACVAGKCVVPCTPTDAVTQCDDLEVCTSDACIDPGVCAHSVLSGPVPGYPQTEGDCQEHRCVEGEEDDVVDNNDVPDDGQECTEDECVAGTPLHTPLAAGEECSGGSYQCDGRGSCVQCLGDADCDDSSGFCYTYACVDNYCQTQPAMVGTPLPADQQYENDCRIAVCDATGNTTYQPEDDPPSSDNNPCTAEGCDGTSPIYEPMPQGAPCGSGMTCDGQGSCCAPPSCVGKSCGIVSNGCGQTLDCGMCAAGDTCGPSTANVCGCSDGVQNGSETGVDCGGSCGTGCGLGTPCSSNAVCSSGFCADGVCCSNACTASCKACTQAKTGVTNGTCADITSGTDPDADCAIQSTTTCGTTGVCAAGICQLHPSGLECSPGSCSGSTQTPASQCNGAGQCVAQSPSSCPAPYSCGGTACQSCADGSKNGTETDTDCGGGGACSDCGLGKVCLAPSDCLSGQCVDGVCCDSGCTGTCMRCNLSNPGVCSPIPAGADPDSECAGPSTCNGFGGC